MRRLAIAFSVILVLIVAAIAVGPRVLPQTTTNTLTAALLKKTLGYPVTVAGPSSLELFPTLRLEARGVSARVSARGGKDTPALFDIGALTLEADALALLYNRVRIDTVRLENPVIRLHVDGDGTANWRRAGGATKPDPAPHLDRDWGWWDQFDIGQVQLLGGRVLWVDRVRNWRLEAERIGLASSKPLNTTSGPGFALAGSAKINGEPVTLRFETGAISKALAGGRFPLVVDVGGSMLSFRYQGAAAKRQVFVSDGSIKLEIPDFPRFRRWLGRGTERPAGGGRLDLAARLDIGGDGVSVGNINLRWPGGKGAGQISAALRRDGTMALDGELHLDTLDIGAIGGETVLAAAAAFLPEKLVGKVNADWRRFRRFNLRGGAGRGAIEFALGTERWTVEAESDDFYGGRARTRVRWGTAEGMASLRTEVVLTKIDAGKLLGDLTDRAALAGRADLRFDLFSVGGDAHQLTAALSGGGRFNVVSGTLTDPGLVRYLSTDDKPVAFSQLLGSFKVGQGIVHTEDLLARIDDMSLIGAGALDLAKGYVDIDMRSVSRKSDGPNARPEIKPFRIEGPVAAFSTEQK